eukprot:6214600-Pleurochrysis_carterae.AAC.4
MRPAIHWGRRRIVADDASRRETRCDKHRVRADGTLRQVRRWGRRLVGVGDTFRWAPHLRGGSIGAEDTI